MIACDKQLNENTESTRSSIKTPYIGQDFHIHWQKCKGKGLYSLFTRREAFIPIIPWGSGLEYLLSTYHLFVVHGD